MRRGCGIYTVADLKDRCRVDDLTGCWLWAGARDSNGRPSTWVPALGIRSGLGVMVAVLKTGARPKPGTAWHCTCKTPSCANPDHRVEGDRSSQMLAIGRKNSPLTRARISASKRKVAKLSDEQAAEILGSEMTLKQISARYGISVGYACEVRSGKRRRPAVAGGSSVFAWGGAA